MDLSKLPKMSQTPAKPPRDESPAHEPGEAPPGNFTVDPADDRPLRAHPVDYPSPHHRAPSGLGFEFWLSLVFGLLCVMLGFRFAKWAATTLTGGTFVTGWELGPPVNPGDPPQGTPIDYWDLTGGTALTEAGLFTYGVALLLLAALLLASSRASAGIRRALTGAGLVVAALATAVNVVAVFYLFSIGILPLYSLLAAVFGGWLTFTLWADWQHDTPAARRAA